MSGDGREVHIGPFDFLEHGGQWMFWCGCGDLVELPEVVHDHCPNCHTICVLFGHPSEANP